MKRQIIACMLGIVGAVAPLAALERGGFSFSLDTGLYAADIGDVGPGWIDVDVRFANGDHHIAEMAAGRIAPHYLVRWADGTCDNPLASCGGEDDITGVVKWADLGFNVVHETSSSTCRGTCRLTVPRFDTGIQFAVLGLWFRWNRDVDHHLREVAVVPDPANGAVYVTFADDAGTEPYSAALTYAMLPVGAVRSMVSRTSTTPATDSVLVPRLPGLAILRGFRFRFTNSDHHLQRFAVDLSPTTDIRLRWRDINGDDPFDWWVSYLILNE